jgi:DNA replication protein DnaC
MPDDAMSDHPDSTPAQGAGDTFARGPTDDPGPDGETAEGFGLALLLGDISWARARLTYPRSPHAGTGGELSPVGTEGRLLRAGVAQGEMPPRPAARSCPACGAALVPVLSPLRQEWVFGPCRVCQAKRDREECDAARQQAIAERQARRRSGLLAQSGLQGRFARRTFAAFDRSYQPLAYEVVLRYANGKARLLRALLDPEAPAPTPEEEDERSQSLILTGENGTGKTHLAAAIVHLLCEAGIPAIFVAASDLLLALRATFGEGAPLSVGESYARDTSRAQPSPTQGVTSSLGERELDLYTRLWQVPLLALDDVDKVHSRSGWHREVLYTIVNRRYELLLPTVVTTNLGRVALGEAIGQATVSRLLEDGLFIAMRQGDYRLNRLTVLGEE